MSRGNEPAFPAKTEVRGNPIQFFGLSKREMLAGMMLQGLVSTTHVTGDTVRVKAPMAEDACALADALIRELARTKDKSEPKIPVDSL